MRKFDFNRLALAELIAGARYPEAGTIVPGQTGIRAYPVRVFRHSVLYSIEPESIYILAVKHYARAPDYWLDRLADPAE